MGEHSAPRDYILPDRAYNYLKPTVQIILPGFGTLYLTLAALWGLPNAEQVVGTCAALAAFLGLFLAFSSRSYANSEGKFDGVINMEKQEDGTTALDLTSLPAPVDLAARNEILLKVSPPE